MADGPGLQAAVSVPRESEKQSSLDQAEITRERGPEREQPSAHDLSSTSFQFQRRTEQTRFNARGRYQARTESKDLKPERARKTRVTKPARDPEQTETVLDRFVSFLAQWLKNVERFVLKMMGAAPKSPRASAKTGKPGANEPQPEEELLQQAEPERQKRKKKVQRTVQ